MSLEKNCNKSLFLAALEMGTPAEREEFLRQECGDNEDLKNEIVSLLEAHEDPPDLVKRVDHNQPTASNVTSPGSQIGPYKLLEAIGEGGMGNVYLAEQTHPVRRNVALKIVRPGLDTTQVIARFEAERQALAMMDHPNIAKVLDAGKTESGRPYFVMELVKGITITEYCDQCHLSTDERLKLFVSVCDAVQHAHLKGIIHRDIKPSNVLVAMQDGRPTAKVIDFGVAKATGQRLTERTLRTGFAEMIGTPLYMSPEQAEMSPLDVDTRSDIYSLGVLLYELLTGTTPFDKEKIRTVPFDELRRIIREEEPPKPSSRVSTLGNQSETLAEHRRTDSRKLVHTIRGDLDWIVMKSLEKDRTRRYETANGLAADVNRYLYDEPVEACPPSTIYRLSKFVKRNRVAIVLMSALLTATILSTSLAIYATISQRRANRLLISERAAQQKTAQALQKAQVAAENERRAHEISARRLAQIEKGNEILGSIFADLNPWSRENKGKSLRVLLGERLNEATEKLEHESVGDPVVVARLQLTLGTSQVALSYPQRAIELLTQARETFAAELGPSHSDTLRTMNNLAVAYSLAGQLDQAFELHREVMKLTRDDLGLDHQNTLASMLNLASTYRERGQLKTAIDLSEQTFELAKAELGPSHEVTLESMNKLASALLDNGQLDQASVLWTRAMKLAKEASFPPEHPLTLSLMNNLAVIYRSTGQLDQAIELLHRTLQTRKSEFGEDHPDTIKAIGNLATAYEQAGQLDRAISLHEQSLTLSKAKLGDNNPDTIVAMGNLATSYKRARRFDQAIAMQTQSLELAKVELGIDHPTTLVWMGNLAVIYNTVGKPDQAVPLFEEQFKHRRVVLGPKHYRTLESMHNLALGYSMSGKHDQALELYKQTLKLNQEVSGPTHLNTLITMNNLAMAYKSAGLLELAIPLFEQTLEIKKAELGPAHHETINTTGNLSSAYRAAGDLGRAALIMQDLVETAKTHLGPNHPDTIESTGNLAFAYLRNKQYEQALSCWDAWVVAERPRVLPNHDKFAGTMAKFSHMLLQHQQYAPSETYLRECLAIREQTMTNHWLLFNTKSLLGSAILGQGKEQLEIDAAASEQAFAEAERLLIDGYEGMKERESQIPDAGRIRLNEALHSLIDLYELWNKQHEAFRWRSKLKSTDTKLGNEK